jgi:hypothetical protein
MYQESTNKSNTVADELRRQEIEKVILSCYTALHDNFFESEYVAAKKAAQEIMEQEATITEGAVSKKMDEVFPEYSGDWSAFIGDKLGDERHRNKWFRIGWNSCRDHAKATLAKEYKDK